MKKEDFNQGDDESRVTDNDAGGNEPVGKIRPHNVGCTPIGDVRG